MMQHMCDEYVAHMASGYDTGGEGSADFIFYFLGNSEQHWGLYALKSADIVRWCINCKEIERIARGL
jgi:hypothetical protein